MTSLGYWGVGGHWDSHPGNGLTGYGRLFRIHAQNNIGASLLDLRYTDDNAGNVQWIEDVPREATNWTWSSYQTVPFDYDDKKVVKSAGTGSNYNATFYRSAYSLTSGKGVELHFKVDRTDTAAHFSVEANDATSTRSQRVS